MRRPVPLPDRDTLMQQLRSAYKPLLDMGVPEAELHKVFLSGAFWSGNKKSQHKMLEDLVKKYVKVDDENEKN